MVIATARAEAGAEREGEEMKDGQLQLAPIKVRRFIEAITAAAIDDAANGIAEYDPRNSGERLIGRLNLPIHRTYPRNGDAKYARSIYTAARWLYQTEKNND